MSTSARTASAGSPASATQRMQLSLFVRPTRLLGSFPPIDPAKPQLIRSEDDIGIQMPAELLELCASGNRDVPVPANATAKQRSDILKSAMAELFTSQAALEKELSLGAGVESYSPDGGPPWIIDPDGTPSYAALVLIGGIGEHPIEGTYPEGSYDCAYRFFVVGRLS